MRNDEMRAHLKTLLKAKVEGDLAAIRTLNRFYDALSPSLIGWTRKARHRQDACAMNDNA